MKDTVRQERDNLHKETKISPAAFKIPQTESFGMLLVLRHHRHTRITRTVSTTAGPVRNLHKPISRSEPQATFSLTGTCTRIPNLFHAPPSDQSIAPQYKVRSNFSNDIFPPSITYHQKGEKITGSSRSLALGLLGTRYTQFF